MELEMTLNRERRELADVKAQLKVIQGTMQYWEQERSNQRDTVVTQKLQLESLQEERVLCNEQLKNLEVSLVTYYDQFANDLTHNYTFSYLLFSILLICFLFFK